MWRSSRVGACRRELSSHKARQSRAKSLSSWSPSYVSASRRAVVPRLNHGTNCTRQERLGAAVPHRTAEPCHQHWNSVRPSFRRRSGTQGCAMLLWRRLREKGRLPRRLEPGATSTVLSGCGTFAARRAPCQSWRALPNPSFKPSTNGVPRGPGWRYAVHFRHPGPRVTPLVPA